MVTDILNFYFSTGEFFTKALFFFILIYGIVILFKGYIGGDSKKSPSWFLVIILIVLVTGSFRTISVSNFENGYTYKVLKIEYPSPVFRIAGERDIYYSLENEEQIFKDKEAIKKYRLNSNSKLSEEETGRLLKELESLNFEKENIDNFLNEVLKSEIKTQINLYVENLTNNEIQEVKKEIKSFNYDEENIDELVLILKLYKEKVRDKLNKA
ncbi:hypothetical protein FV113G1_P10200 (plasmid) [Fusobacterium varium]|nr:hypothetical protein FV113G1_P10200 [Fusobacterium varium]